MNEVEAIGRGGSAHKTPDGSRILCECVQYYLGIRVTDGMLAADIGLHEAGRTDIRDRMLETALLLIGLCEKSRRLDDNRLYWIQYRYQKRFEECFSWKYGEGPVQEAHPDGADERLIVEICMFTMEYFTECGLAEKIADWRNDVDLSGMRANI